MKMKAFSELLTLFTEELAILCLKSDLEYLGVDGRRSEAESLNGLKAMRRYSIIMNYRPIDREIFRSAVSTS